MRNKPFWLAVMAVVFSGDLHQVAGQGRGIPGSVAFFSARDGNNEIYVMDPDGSGPLRITNNPASDVDPDISTNGRDIVFTSNRGGNNDIYIVDSHDGTVESTSRTTPPTTGGRAGPLMDSTSCFTRNRDGNFEIYMMNRDGSDPARLTELSRRRSVSGLVTGRSGDRLPKGRRYPRTGRGKRRDASSDRRTATQSDARVVSNGKQLAFMSTRDGYISVFLMNADGSNQRNLTPKNPGDLDGDWISRAPSWSTSGRQIYFMSFRPSTGLDTEIFVMNWDGSGATRLTHSIGMDGSPRAR